MYFYVRLQEKHVEGRRQRQRCIRDSSAVESDYSIIVTDSNASRDGIDTLTSIEAFEFGGTSAFLSDLLNPTDVDNGVYRFFNLGTGTHFYSASPVERLSMIHIRRCRRLLTSRF